jgi:hypothetical protein
MPIKQVFEKQEDVPEFLRGSVVEQDGKFVFEAELPTETAGVKSALQKEREAKAALEKSLKGFEGIDPEEARKLKAEAEQIAIDKLKSKGDWETREKQLKDQLAKDLETRQTTFNAEQQKWQEREIKLTRAIQKNIAEAQAVAAITAADGSAKVLLPHAMNFIRVIEENDDFKVVVVDGQGNPRIADVKGTPFGIKNLIEEFKKDPEFGTAFKATVKGGGDAHNHQIPAGNGKTMTREAFEQLGPSEKAQFFRDKGTLTN